MPPFRKPFLILCTLLAAVATGAAADAYKWSVQYLIDNSRSVFGRPQKVYPRNNRGLAISPDGKFLYAGYNHSFHGQGEVRRIALGETDYEAATASILAGPLGKALGTDDKGRVYIADVNEVLIYNADLTQRQVRIATSACEGLVAVREGDALVLYTTDRREASLQRWVLSEAGESVTGAKLAGFDGSGVFRVPGAIDLRGIEVDAQGHLWIADLQGNKVFRLQRDDQELRSVQVEMPIDLALSGERIFVTRWRERAITVLDLEMNVLGNLNVPWEELELSVFGNNRYGALSGIVAVPDGGFFVANEVGQTANQRSTYGRADDRAALIDGQLFKDAEQDDNDPILRATAITVEP